MPDPQMTSSDFAAKIKAKYPDYANIPDTELVAKMITKYPEYRDKVSFAAPEARTPQELAAQAMRASGVPVGGRVAPIAPKVNMQEQRGVGAAMGAYANSIGDNANKAGRVYRAFGQDVSGAVQGIGHLAKAALTDPTGNPSYGLAKAMVTPVVESADDKTQSKAETMGAAFGVNSPAIKQAALNEDYPSIIGHSILPVGLAALGGRVAEKVMPSRSIENHTAKYANNLSGAIGETTKTVNVPAEAKGVIQDIRQVAANSGMTPADFKGAKAPASVRQAIAKTLDAHEANYQQLFDSIRDNPVPDAVKARIKNAIGQEVNNAMETLMPEDANSINALRQRASNLETWNDINDARQLMNRASQAVWKKPDAMQSSSPNHTQALQTGSNVIRDELYGEIGKANGLSEDAVRALKQKEGSLLKLDAMVEGLENKTANAQGNWVSTTKLDKFRNGNYASVGSAVKDALLKQSPQDIVASKASRAFADLPTPNRGIGISPNIANMPLSRSLLPAQTGGAFYMGASEPGMTLGERVAVQGQQLRQRQPFRLPEAASGRTDSVPLPDSSAMSPGERVAAIQQWVRENQARLTNRKALPIQAEPKRLPASSLGRNK